MKPEPVFLAVEHALAIHRRVVDEFGGNAEVRDRGLLESAVLLPSARFRGEFLHKSLAAMAAAYLFGICRNHPFVDGNKRTALAAAEVFLMLNGRELKGTNRELADLTLAVAEGRASKADVAAFFGRHIAASRRA